MSASATRSSRVRPPAVAEMPLGDLRDPGDRGDPGDLGDPGDPGDPGDAERVPSVRMRVAIGAALVLVVVALVASVLITALSPVGATTVFGDGAAVGSGAGAGAGAPASDALPDAALPDASSPDASSPVAAPPAASSGATAAGEAVRGGAPPGSDASRATILVHLLGSVVRPGVFELPEGSRAVDAIALAGGFAESADQSSLNLARVLVDGEQLRVLAVGETPPPPVAGAGAAATGGAGSGGGGAGAGGAAGGSGVTAPGGAGSAPGILLNLNAATALDLDTLPRIGPAMADRIITWRDTNGPFASVDDLLQVTGIGDKTLESLRPLVTV